MTWTAYVTVGELGHEEPEIVICWVVDGHARMVMSSSLHRGGEVIIETADFLQASRCLQAWFWLDQLRRWREP